MTSGAPRLAWIAADDPPEAFPPVAQAFTEPDGLLAAGGDLSPSRLLYAYAHGIFPWYDEGQPVLWWSPDPRCVIDPNELQISRRLRRSLRNSGFRVTFNRDFSRIVRTCAEPRSGQRGTWITDDMLSAYTHLHKLGWAHSVEVWQDETLAGGLYGLAIGKAFFGESMFTRVNDGSKAALTALSAAMQARDMRLLDGQVESPHLLSLGAALVPRARFCAQLADLCVAMEQQDFDRTIESPIRDFL